jgi:hypothetical protein
MKDRIFSIRYWIVEGAPATRFISLTKRGREARWSNYGSDLLCVKAAPILNREVYSVTKTLTK